MDNIQFPVLHKAAFRQLAIDNHAHPLLRADMRSAIPFEGVFSEAQGDALVKDAPHTLACYRVTKQLAQLYGMTDPVNVTWDQVKEHRDKYNYTDLCALCFKEAGILSEKCPFTYMGLRR